MQIQLDNNPPITWEQFLSENDPQPELFKEIETALLANGVYFGGGGAEAAYQVKLLPESIGIDCGLPKVAAYLSNPNHCPHCGTLNIEAQSGTEINDNDAIAQRVICLDCGRSWQDIYTLTAVKF